MASSRRTIVVKFVLENFKSYAGVREIGPMHKRFLAVVGPNGSGKSNLIDALLFIFGKRAKKLRMKNLSSLIHNSAEHPNAKEARVEIHFCEVDDNDPTTKSEDTDDYNVLPGSEFVLARTVRQDNSTYYTLNGRRQTFDEVEQFMKLRGIDINNNRFLILQGEVEAISLMKPKGETKHEEGMLEFLEELIGTDRYVDEIEAKQQLVETLGQNRSVCLEQVKIGEKEMASLEGPKDDAVRLRELEISILDKQHQILASRTAQSLQACDVARDQLQAVNSEFGSTKLLLDEQKTAMASLQTRFDQEQARHGELAKEQQDGKQEWERFERKDIKERTKSKQMEARVDKLTAALAAARQTREQEEEKQFELEAALPQLASQVADDERALQESEQQLEQMFVDNREESRQVRERVERKQLELAPFAVELSQCESDCTLLERELDLLQRPGKEAKLKLEVAEKDLAEAQSEVLASAGVAQQQQATQQCALELEQARQALALQRQQEGELEQELDSVLAALKQQEEEDGGAAGGGASVWQKMLQSKKKRGGELEGCQLFGRLGDLGSVSAELDCAATTAAGGQLDSYVAQTTEDAERCVAFLRAHKLGVCTFIILDKMHAPPPPHSSNNTDSDAPRLIDSIQPTDGKFLPAFYHAVRDTLVCRDLEHAMQVAYDDRSVCRHRVVTLKGELIDNSGTMSGGGKPRRGGFSGSASAAAASSSDGAGMSQEEVAQAKARAQHIADVLLVQVRAEIARLVRHVAELERAVVRLEDEAGQWQRTHEAAQQRLALAQSRVHELSSAVPVGNAKEEEAELERRLRERQPQLAQARQRADVFTGELEELNAQLRRVGGERAERCRQSVDSARTALDKARAKFTKAQVQLEASHKQLAKLEQQVEHTGADMELALAEQAHHDQERKKTEERAMEIAQRLQLAGEAVQQVVQELERTKREYFACKQKLNELENANVDMKLKLQAGEDAVRKAEQRKLKWEDELEQARRNLANWKRDAGVASAVDDDADAEMEPVQQQQDPPTDNETATVHSDSDLQRMENEVARAEAEAKSLRGNVNMGAIAEYKLREREYLARVAELDQASQQRDEARAQCDELKKARLVEFMAGFSVISLKLKEIYQLITLGGDAELELVDSLDPFSEGVVFSVRPPKKSWKNISNLSGGEKTLSSLSLVFALHAFRGAPIYVMDEIDAALDFKNVSIVANYIKERTKNAQFLIISLRNNMFELADRLVGVYKTNNATKSVTIDPKKVAEKSGIAQLQQQQEQERSRRVLQDRNQ